MGEVEQFRVVRGIGELVLHVDLTHNRGTGGLLEHLDHALDVVPAGGHGDHEHPVAHQLVGEHDRCDLRGELLPLLDVVVEVVDPVAQLLVLLTEDADLVGQ